MKRRGFLRLLSAVSVIMALPKALFARREPLAYFPEPRINFQKYLDTSGPVETYADYQRLFVPIFKITSINGRIGFESFPHSVEPNQDGYLLIPEDPKATEYALYAPMHGFERVGPWYLVRTISRREARRARFTIAAPDYQISNLIPRLCPFPDDHFVTFNLDHLPLADGIDHFKIYSGFNPKSPASIIVRV